MFVDGKRSGRISVLDVFVLLGLLALPMSALARLAVDWRWVGGYLLVLNALTCWAYIRDKRKARNGEWRISEAHLHLLELLGGWPAAFLAQRRLRHKCSKSEYQLVFWIIVLAYQFLAFDAFQGWRISQALFEQTTPRGKSNSASRG